MNTTATRCRAMTFTVESVRAIIAGTKTQTRRVLTPQPKHRLVKGELGVTIGMPPEDDGVYYDTDGIGPGRPVWPKHEVGSLIWCREPFRVSKTQDAFSPSQIVWDRGVSIVYAAGGSRAHNDAHQYANDFNWPWKPSEPHTARLPEWIGRPRPARHMVKEASRITLEVTSVRFEPLHAITDADAVAEGITWFSKDGALRKYWMGDFCDGTYKMPWCELPKTAVAAYQWLWDEINGARQPWRLNPIVEVIEFRRVEAAGNGR